MNKVNSMLVRKLSKKASIIHVLSSFILYYPYIIAKKNNYYFHSLICFNVLISSIFYSSIRFFDKKYQKIIFENDKIWAKILILFNLYRYVNNGIIDLKPIITCFISLIIYNSENTIERYTLLHPFWRLFSSITTYYIIKNN